MDSRSLNDSARLQCYTTNTEIRAWQFQKVLKLLICLLSICVFVRLWFITILSIPAYATLTRGEAFVQSFPVEKDYDWRP